MAQTTTKKTNLARLFRTATSSRGRVVRTVLLMILPVRPFFLDGFLAMSIALSLLILLSILYVKEPGGFHRLSRRCCCSSRFSGFRSTSPPRA